MGPMHWIRGWGLAYGIYPWQRTGDGRFDGEAFWMGCGFFSWGGGGGEEELQGTTAETFSQTTRVPNSPVYVYIIYCAVEVSLQPCERPSRTVTPILDALGRHVRCSGFDNPSTESRIEDGEGAAAPRSATDSTEQWV